MNVTIIDNVTRWLAHHGLLGTIDITSNEEDRCYGWPKSHDFLGYMVENEWDSDAAWAANMQHGGKRSFREPGGVHPCLQVVFHPVKLEERKKMPWVYFVEIDFDLSSPLSGPLDLIEHSGEVIVGLTGKKTSQQQVADLLDKRFTGIHA
jgi:hypothetical protein